MTHNFIPPEPKNEVSQLYAPGSPEKRKLKKALDDILNKPPIEVPLVIKGERITTENKMQDVCPHDHAHVLANYSVADADLIKKAIDSAMEVKSEWQEFSFEDKSAIFLKAANLLSGKYRYKINAGTMLSMSKNCWQAEIDSACELIDFLNFNVYFASQIYSMQTSSPSGMLNKLVYRPLEGFVFAVTPFNFLSIAGNLPTSPAIMGNVVIFKPSSSAVLPAYLFYQILEEAGLPDGVINFIPCPGRVIGDVVLTHPDLAGIHFTGSTKTFQHMWKTIGNNIEKYKSYPRLVGETGGKDFIFLHKSADVDAAVVGTLRAAFEYQGQKCSAASRLYCPDNLWDEFKEKLLKGVREIKIGNPVDFTNYLNAIIDETAFDSIVKYIEFAKSSEDCEILIGGTYIKSKGYFIDPTVILAKKPDFKTMVEEIFGPVLTIYVYPADKYEETLKLCDETSPYALTGSIFAKSRKDILKAQKTLYYSAGNFYINDKCTAAVVGQQPFGGGRASGTNDKAGSLLNLIRWTTPLTIKETYDPPVDYKYPFMEEE